LDFQKQEIIKYFDVKELLGQGSYGCVLRVLDKESINKRDYALKVYHYFIKASFNNFKQVISMEKHPIA